MTRITSRFFARSAPDIALTFFPGTFAQHWHTHGYTAHAQESNFHYLFGVAEPDCYATIATDSGRATLFVPRLPAEYAVWMGAIGSPQDFALRYEVDAVHYVDELPAKVWMHGRVRARLSVL